MASEIRHPGQETYGPIPINPGIQVSMGPRDMWERESHEALKCMVVGRVGGWIQRRDGVLTPTCIISASLKVGNISENSVGATL